jgi:predicted flap endonuclease-1-like 5' DNA nuclease
MATKKAKKISKLEKAKASVKKINNTLIDASFEAIETTVKTGEKWQKLTSKLIKKTEPITEQQIKMFLEATETIKQQLEKGTTRLKDLVGYDPKMFEQAKEIVTENPLAKKAEKITSKLKKEVAETLEEVKEKVEDVAEDVIEKAEEVLEDVKTKLEGVEKKGKKAAKKTKKTASKKKNNKATAKKAVKKTTAKKTPVIKTAAKKVVAKKPTVKNDLKVIKGIGPKIETILNAAGITSYEGLAKMTVANINKVLTDAGIVNIKIYNTSQWKAQAIKAAKANS